jgi:PAS domain S-box-containing protein
MFWLYLLGIVTVLTIVVRRLLRRQQPLIDELYSQRIAIDQMSSGVAWIPANGSVHSVNRALAQMLGAPAEQLAGRNWLQMFAESERPRVEQVYSETLIAARASFNTLTIDVNGVETPREVRMAAVYDHKMRLMGHHCIIDSVADQGPEASRQKVARRIRANIDSTRSPDHKAQFATLSS